MRITFILSVVVLSVFNTIFAQESRNKCAKRDAFANMKKEHPNLTPQEINEESKYDVHFYALDVAMDNLSTDMDGTGEIHGTVKEDLDSVLFELFSSFTITEIRLDDVSTPYNRTGSSIKVPVNLTAGQDFKIAVDYNGNPPTQVSNPLGGSGMTNATSYSWGAKVTWSLSEPFSAYEWFPCKQDLRDKADSVSMKITVPNNCKAGSNGVLENVVDLGNGKSRYEWFHRHPIDYYLISIAISDYVEYNIYASPAGSVNPVLIQNYVYGNPNALSYFQDDIDATADFLELFADLYGKYPFDNEKYGHCMAPIGGGMEHQTMTTQGSFDKELTAHELAHQWFGNSVTCASWSDVWVNEGFAEYSSHLMLEYLGPGNAAQNMLDIHSRVMDQPNGSIWVLDSLNDSAIFNGRLTYDKGAAFVHTLRFMMNDDSLFYQALRNYLTDFKDSVALALDVRDHLNTVSSVNFDAAFNQWYYGEGYPTYSLKWNSDGDDLYVVVTHTTSSTTPTFTTPLELLFERTALPDTIIRLAISSNDDSFIIPNFEGTVSSVVVDPNNWIINEVGSIVKDDFLSVSKESATPDLTIFPNPSAGAFTISINDDSKMMVYVYSPRGEAVHKEMFYKTTKLDLHDLSGGYYIIKITDDKGRAWIKTVVKK